MLEQLVSGAPVFFLVAIRCFALISTVPLLSTNAVPRAAKAALAGYTAFIVLPSALSAGWNVPPFSLDYAMLVIGEALIGIITGFYISLIFGAFSTAGQFFTYQMGFGASEVYDALAQVENPLMGQFFNLIAMLLFLQVRGFHQLFLGGIFRSFQSINALTLAAEREQFLNFLLRGLTELFFDAMMIALPILGTLFLVSICTGLLSKAAPQMNLLSEGLPITILVAFLLLTWLLPILCNVFINAFDAAFIRFEDLLSSVTGARL